MHTNFILMFGDELLQTPKPDHRVIATAVAAKLFSEAVGNGSGDVFHANVGFRLNHNLRRKLKFLWKGEMLEVVVEFLPDASLQIKFLEQTFNLSTKCEKKGNGGISVKINVNGEIYHYSAAVTADSISVIAIKVLSRYYFLQKISF